MIAVHPLPFKIGRSPDCHLVLPDSPELSRATSRWHCYIKEEGGRSVLVDGSLEPLEETGKIKPSISGTFLNGKRVATAGLAKGDEIAVGPWKFRVEESRQKSVNIDHLLEKLGAQAPMALDEGDPILQEGFSQLHELFTRFNQTQNNAECLTAILTYALEKIKNAEVAAILEYGPDGAPTVRLAWQKGVGQILDFRFSSGLVSSLPPHKAFLLKTHITDITKSQMEQNISSGLLIPLRGSQGRLGVLYMDNRNHGTSFAEQDLYLANALASVISLQLALEKQAFLSRVENNMQQYFGPDVVKLIVEESRLGRPVSLGVRECEATILFVDIEGFSTFCRTRKPQEVSELLNPYFQIVAESIQNHGGHVDKFIGDGAMGVFGAKPIDAQNASSTGHAEQAVNAARQIIDSWSRWSLSRWGAPIPVRVGINTGKVVAGNIGFTGRMEYSVLGDAVNLAARLESHAHPNGIAISKATYDLIGGKFVCTYEGEENLKNFGVVKIWRL